MSEKRAGERIKNSEIILLGKLCFYGWPLAEDRSEILSKEEVEFYCTLSRLKLNSVKVKEYIEFKILKDLTKVWIMKIPDLRIRMQKAVKCSAYKDLAVC